MKLISVVALAVLAFAGTALAGPPGLTKLRCFDGGGATCTTNEKGAAATSAVLAVPAGGWAGVYSNNPHLYGSLVGGVPNLSFQYGGDEANASGPRFSIPIDTDGDGITEFYAFVSAFYCDTPGVVSLASCTIWAGAGSYADWAAMVAANPGWTIGRTEVYDGVEYKSYIFIIQDQGPGTWTISNVNFGM